MESSNNCIRSIIDSITDALIVTDAHGKIRTVNRAALNFMECDENDIVGKFIKDILLYGKKEHEKNQPDLNGRMYNFETTIKSMSGIKIPVLLSSSMIGDSSNEEGVVYILKNITDRQAALNALKESEERFKQIARNAMEWIWEVDAKGLFIYSNSIVQKIIGYSEDEIVGKRYFYEFINPDADIAQKRKTFNAAGKNESLRGIVYPCITREKRKILLETNFSPILDDNENLLGYRGSATDITRRIKNEQKLKDAQKKAEQASIAKSQFLANMSHEIRTPMNAVLGFTELLANTKLTKEQKDYLATIKESGDLLMSLINDILDISKIEAEKIDLENIQFNLEYLARSAIKIISSRLKNNSVRLNFDYDRQSPRYFMGDPTKIKQVFLNLLGNAAKFTSSGYIGVSISCEKMDDVDSGNRNAKRKKVKVVVKDTGIGIPEKDRENIFRAFIQADASVTRKYGGSGLGLTITKAFIEKMGGLIRADSREGEGTEFSFYLMLEECEPASDDYSEYMGFDSLKNQKAIILDNQKRTNKEALSLCEKAGMDVIKSFYSDDELMEWMNGKDFEKPDLIIMDLSLKDLDEFRLSRWIRNRESFRNVNLIAVASSFYRGEAEKTRKMGFNGFLTRPFNDDEFYNMLAAVLEDDGKKQQIITRHSIKENSIKEFRLLIVDDNEVNLKLGKILLRKMGYGFDIARNGEEAIEKVKKTDYNLILMDLQMPVMDGIKAVSIIRNELGKNMPVIAMTAASTMEDIEKALTTGMDDYMLKPIKVDDLKEKIQKWLYV